MPTNSHITSGNCQASKEKPAVREGWRSAVSARVGRLLRLMAQQLDAESMIRFK